MPREADRVAEQCTTTGTGTLTLAGALAGHRAFVTAFGAGTTVVHYGVLHDTDGTWETGIGTFSSGANSLARDMVLSSSSAGSKVAFASGNKIVYVQAPAEVSRLIRNRRPADVALDIEPAAGQSAAMIRVKNTSGGNAFTVDAAGGVAAGGVTLSGSAPGVAMVETDASAPAGRYRFVGVGGHLEVQRSTSGDFASVSTQVRLKSDGSIELMGAISAPGANIVAPLLRPSAADANGAVALTIGTARPWVFRQRGTGNNAHLELAGNSANRTFMIATDTGAAGFGFDPYERSLQLYGAGSDAMVYVTDGGNHRFKIGAVDVARIEPAGSSFQGAISVMTREKADARYSIASSSASLKREISDLIRPDLSDVHPRSFVWALDGHPREGQRGAGFIYEDVAEAFPAATYPAREGRPGGIDALALLAGFVAELRARLDALEQERPNGRRARKAA